MHEVWRLAGKIGHDLYEKPARNYFRVEELHAALGQHRALGFLFWTAHTVLCPLVLFWQQLASAELNAVSPGSAVHEQGSFGVIVEDCAVRQPVPKPL